MLYGPDGCRGDVEYANVTMASLKKIAKELEKANRLKEAELLIQIGEKEKAAEIVRSLHTKNGK
jgi:uncharacterized protein HemY